MRPAMKRENMRVVVGQVDIERWLSPVTDADLAEMGFVKLDPLDAGLWVLTEDGQKARPAVAADLERLGYVPADGVADLAMERDQAQTYADEVMDGGEEFERLAEKHGWGPSSRLRNVRWTRFVSPTRSPDMPVVCGFRLVALDGIDFVEKWPEGHQLIASMAPYWNLTDWLAEGRPELQGKPEEIISEAWDVINYLAKQYDGLRSRVLAAMDGETA